MVDEVGKLIHYVRSNWRILVNSNEEPRRVPLVLAEVEMVVTEGASSLYDVCCIDVHL